MKRSTAYTYQPDSPVNVTLTGGMITIKDSSRKTVQVFCGMEPLYKAIAEYLPTCYGASPGLNAAIEKYLPYCDRVTQEKFIQILNDHIRKIDNAKV